MRKEYIKPELGKRFRYNKGYKNAYMSECALAAKKRVQAKIDNGTYKSERCNCYCGSDDSLLISERERYGFYHPFVICRNCGIMRANPRLDKNVYEDLYTHEYRTLYGDNNIDKESVYNNKLKQAEEICAFITKHVSLNHGDTVFDIGCNMGATLVPFAQSGYEVAGVDYGTEYIEFGRKKTALDLRLGGIEKLKTPGKKAGLVILNHVLEHFLDLEKELADIRSIIKPGGFIYISLPGTFWWIKNACAGNIMDLLQSAHIWQFSLNSLRYVMASEGFEFICGDENVRSIFRLNDKKEDKTEPPKGEFEKVLSYLKKAERRYLPRAYAVRLLELVGVKRAKNV